MLTHHLVVASQVLQSKHLHERRLFAAGHTALAGLAAAGLAGLAGLAGHAA